MSSLSDIPIVGKVTEDISSATIEGLKREFLYMYKCKDNVNALKAKMKELEDQEEKIKRKIEIATDDGWIIEECVRKWQEDVKQIKDEEKVEEFLEMYKSKRSWRCLKVLRFPNLYSRFRTGREAVKKAEKMNGLTVRGEELANREIGQPRRFVYADSPSDNDYVRFESREDAYKKILEALNNNDAGFLVGIYGMAGAGKTRMMEQAWKQAKKDGIFDEVARADVGSEKLDVRKLQDLLAGCLNLHLQSEENEEIRASRLANRLTGKGNKILVLFDDVWEELPLNKIGVPFGDDRRKGCKILLTSRDRGVCFKNNCENPIEINVLKEEEGWGLFTKNVGSSTINSLHDKSLAKKVCDECACLPLVIAAVGKALKGKLDDSWEGALHQLQVSKLEIIDGIDPKVHAALVLSFNHSQKDAKSCLFLCSAFPEDAAISIEELVRLMKGNRLIGDSETLEIARKRVRSMVAALKDSSLLLPYDDDTKVKLHDIIRDVAKSEAAKDPAYAFLEKSRCTKWPDLDRCKDRKLVSLSFDNINYFPYEDDLTCPELHTLVLNLENTQFPDRFFNGFPKLRVLVLHGRSTFPLPSSLQSLTNLRMLSLYNADLNMSLIKELKNLEMLIILGDIKELPLELRELKHLRLLVMSSSYRRKVIMPRHLLSSLSNLEELYIPREFMSYRGKEERGGDLNPIHHELCKLTNLTTLHILLPDVLFLPNEELCQKLLRYVIYISPDDEAFAILYLDSEDKKRALCLSKVALLGRSSSSLEILLESAEYMKLVRVNGFQTYFNNFNHRKAFANLTRLFIGKCDDLEHLSILQNYQQLPHPQPMRSFSKLTELEIESSGFKYLFCPSSARCLVQLQKLHISGCKMMEEIIRPREQELEEEEEIIEFPNLKDMILRRLPRLKSFYCKKINTCSATPDQNTSTSPVHPLFNGMVSFPVLEKMTISDIARNVKETWGPQCHIKNSFSQLKILDVDSCEKLENVIPFAMLGRLQNLETLKVDHCSSLKCIVNGAKTAMTEDQEGSDSEIVFPVLKTLALEGLPKLDNFWCTRSMGSTIDQHQPSLLQKVSFPVLEKMTIAGIENAIEIWEPQCHLKNSFPQLKILNVWSCEKLENVIPFAMLGRLQNLEILEVYRCNSLKCIVNGAKTAMTEDQEGSDSEIVFPVLRTLILINMPKLDNFWCTRSMGSTIDQHQPSLLQKVSFPRLENLEIGVNLNWEQISFGNSAYQLRSLEIVQIYPVFPPSWLVRLQCLEELEVIRCVSNIPLNLLCFRGLKRLYVNNCKLSTLFACSLAKTNLQQLEVLSVKWCKEMEEIVSDENEGNKKMVATGTNAHAADETILIVFPRLKRIELVDLPVLTSFCGSARYTFNMRSLEEVQLRYCPRMINFTCRQLTTPPKFKITDEHWNTKECTDLNKYLQSLFGPEGELEMAKNSSDCNQDKYRR